MADAGKKKGRTGSPPSKSAIVSPGRPVALPLTIIDEDPAQPRRANSPGFSTASLAELAASIRLRHVKTPISVRSNPDQPGRFLINHGARRFRASALAGMSTIPAFIDDDFTEADQIVENLQRNELTPREIADYIGRELAKGKKKGEIATAISKSPAFVTQHATLLDLPDAIARCHVSGRANDVTVINELVLLHRRHPLDVETWLRDAEQELTRGAVKLFRSFLDDKYTPPYAPMRMIEQHELIPSAEREPEQQRQVTTPTKGNRIARPVVHVVHAGRTATMALHRRPSGRGTAWIEYSDTGVLEEVDLQRVVLVALLDQSD